MTIKKRKVINMNYPPKDMPMEELERFWGSPDDIPDDWAEKARKIKPVKKYAPTPL